jgi:hypothetical protein
MRPIRIPAIPASAYNPDRPANDLLLAQARELEKAVRAAGRRVQGAKLRTEGEVAAYIRHLNRALYHQVLLPAIKRKPVRPPKPPATAKRTTVKRATAKPVTAKRVSPKRKPVRAKSRSRSARKRGAKR